MQVKNKKLSYRLLALMLTLVMLLGMIPVTALATDTQAKQRRLLSINMS